MDNKRDPELPEETFRLVRELGARLEQDAGKLQFRGAGDLSYADPYDFLQAQIDSFRRELEEVELKLRKLLGLDQKRPEDWEEMRDLEERRWMLNDGLRHLDRGFPAPWRLRHLVRMPIVMPDYLRPLAKQVSLDEAGAYWLHGEDARERGRAGDILTVLLAEGGKRSWATAVIDLSQRPVRRRDRLPGSELEFAVRRVWDTWDEDPGARPPIGILRGPAFRIPGSRGRSGVAIFLPEFPARDKKAAPFLEWLASGMAVGSVPQLVIVSAESPPEAPVGAGFRPVLCESAAVRMGRRIAELRLQKGWNRAEFAARSEIPQSTLAQVEGGLRLAGRPLLKRIAQALGTDPDELRRA